MRGRMLACALLSALVITALGATQGRAAPPPNGHALTGQTPDVVAQGKAKLRGHHKADDLLTLNIGQAVHNSSGLDAFIAAVSDRRNPLYKHYLTNAQYMAQYAPTAQETQAVRDWATGAGLTVTSVSPDNLLVSVQGTTPQVEHAFNVTINDYDRGDGSTFQSNDRDATVPANLDVQAVTGLSDYEQPVVANLPVNSGVPGYFPNDYRTAYDMGPVGNANDQKIGLTLWGGKMRQSDLDTFATQSGTPRLVAGQAGANGIDWNGIDGNPMTDTNAITQAGEVALDVEYAHGVAPGSHLRYWLGPCAYSPAHPGDCSHGTLQGLQDAVNAAANDPDVRIVSNSWSVSGVTSAASSFVQNVDSSLQHAAAAGVTFYFATGDFGRNTGCYDPTKPSRPCPPAYPAASPYAVAVGGTSLDTNTDGTYKSEGTWDDNGNSNEAGGASGGGCSTFEPRPSWQNDVPIAATNDGNPCTGRAIPDVAAAAGGDSPANVYVTVGNNNTTGQNYTIVGTSLATPLWAGMTADLNNTLGHAGFFLAGFTGPQLYQFAGDSSFDPTLFHDVTTKEPGPSYTYGAAYPAGTGWDEATGLGSVDANFLLSFFEQYSYPATISTVAGVGSQNLNCPPVSGQATQASIVAPEAVAADRSGNVYIADSSCSVVDKVNISVFAGQPGNPGYAGDGGPATSAQLDDPQGLAVDGNGNVYIADGLNAAIREVTTDNKIRTFAGIPGNSGYNGTNMAATQTELDDPFAVAVNNSNNVYVTDSGNYLVRHIDPTGKMTIVAGVPGRSGYNGDNIAATSATLSDPVGVAADSKGNVFIADRDRNRIREVPVSNGNITTIAGTGTAGDTGDGGLATAGQISGPYGLALDSFNNLYFSEQPTNYVREVLGGSDTLYTVAGTGACGATGDGVQGGSLSATLCDPEGLALDRGNSQLYIADFGNAKVRKLSNVLP